MTIYGYARVSTRTQKLERQIHNLELAGVLHNKIYSEKFTGVKSSESRPQWLKLLKVVKAGDTIIFDSVSRMSRSEDGIDTYFNLVERGINLVFLKEPQINSEVYGEALTTAQSIQVDNQDLDSTVLQGVRDYLILIAKKQIQLAFEQSAKEAQDIRQRVIEGLASSDKKAGVPKGTESKRKLKLPKDFIERKETMNKSELARFYQVSRPTIHKWFKELDDILEFQYSLIDME